MEEPVLRHRSGSTWTAGVTLVAAYMLVLQGLFGAFAMGAANAGEMLDVFGNPLCITSMDSEGQATGPGDHSVLPDCCTGVCGMFAPLTVDDRTPHSLSNPLRRSERVEAASGLTVLLLAPGHNPGSPRAPPATA